MFVQDSTSRKFLGLKWHNKMIEQEVLNTPIFNEFTSISSK